MKRIATSILTAFLTTFPSQASIENQTQNNTSSYSSYQTPKAKKSNTRITHIEPSEKRVTFLNCPDSNWDLYMEHTNIGPKIRYEIPKKIERKLIEEFKENYGPNQQMKKTDFPKPGWDIILKETTQDTTPDNIELQAPYKVIRELSEKYSDMLKNLLN